MQVEPWHGQLPPGLPPFGSHTASFPSYAEKIARGSRYRTYLLTEKFTHGLSTVVLGSYLCLDPLLLGSVRRFLFGVVCDSAGTVERVC